MRRVLLFIGVGVALLSQSAGQPLSADTVVFTNGAKLEGEIVREDGEQLTIAVDGGSITVRRSEITSITKTQERQPPETLKSYGQKMARWTEVFTIQNRGVIETASGLLDGRVNASATVQAFEQYQQEFSVLKQRLDQLVPPPELEGVHALLLQATDSKTEACRSFRMATEKHDDALYEEATAHQQKSNELMEQALAQLDSVRPPP